MWFELHPLLETKEQTIKRHIEEHKKEGCVCKDVTINLITYKELEEIRSLKHSSGFWELFRNRRKWMYKTTP
jgi:hypothetical protein